ncbi:MAG TPA: hypothetical protein VFA07_04865 [Chthonomonadaceae bacterium]|nr:hypothetical protein [Chthonomonadaceae bacterium]
MRLPFPKMILPAAILGGALLFMGASSQAAPRPDTTGTQAAADTAAQTPPPPTATLQVSGTATEFTISADHADVQSALKLIFDQAGKQFVLSNDVLGQVTLRLDRQPFNTVIGALCDQAFLRYQISPAGIYQFSRNTEALHTFILRQSTLNEALLQKLRSLNFSSVLNLLPASPAVPSGKPLGGLGGSGLGGAAQAPQMSARRLGGVLFQDQNTAALERVAPNGQASYIPNLAASAAQSSIASEAQIIVQPGLVSVRTLPDHPVALTALLQELSRQTHIPILIDPQVPSGIKFRFKGNLAAHSLTEWLERLAPIARLEWYSVNNQIFITTSPDFALFYGSSDVPRATSGMQASPVQQGAAAKPSTGQKSEPNK